ncbi:MAG: hypothetical protein ACP5T6_02320 [Candidatus Micrarchaeia archaeon]
MNKSLLGLGILVILIIVIGFIFYWNGSSMSVPPAILTNSTSSNATSTMALMITDPPFVPIGTESLILSYNKISLHEAGTSNYYNTTTGGSVNILSLSNITETIAMINVPKNASFDSVTFEGLSARAVINNQTYNITLPSSNLTVSLSGNASARLSKALLVDLSPSLMQVYNSSNSTFVLKPQAIASALSGNEINSSMLRLGARIRINQSIMKRLNEMFPNISITSSSLSESGNTISFSISIKNNDNSSVKIKHIMLIGFMAGIKLNNSIIGIHDERGVSPISVISNSINSTINSSSINNVISVISNETKISKSNISKIISNATNIMNNSGLSENDIVDFGREFREMGFENIHFNKSINESITEAMHGKVPIEEIQNMIKDARFFDINFHDTLNFIVAQNGSLTLPFDLNEAEGPNGYNIQADSSHTFTFNGNVSLGNGRIAINIIPNQTYYVIVIGEDGAHAIANVTAS